MPETAIEDIPHLPDQEQRLDALLVDCYGRGEELSAFDVYFADALRPPFAATWRDPDDPRHAEAVTVLGLARVDDRRGVLLTVSRGGKRDRRVLAEQLWGTDPHSANAIILDDYRHWVASGGLDAEDDA
jgi:hypothetical protein